MQVALVHRIVGGLGHGLRVALQRPPEVREQPIGVVHRLDVSRAARPQQQHGQRTGERLDEIRHVAERSPDVSGYGRLAAEVGEGGLVCGISHPAIAHSPPSGSGLGFLGFFGNGIRSPNRRSQSSSGISSVPLACTREMRGASRPLASLRQAKT